MLANKSGAFEGRYTYNEILVGSKTGESLMAFDEQTSQPVVIKRPSPLQPNPNIRQASIADLAREERALSTPGIRDHPGVCRLLDAGESEGQGKAYRYLVLERAAGVQVSALIREYHARGQAFPERNYLGIMRQLLDILASAHAAGVLYNDVKADHLFWDEAAARLKLIDWGNAQFLAEAGTATPAADLFQCGELLYEFVTGTKYSRAPAADWRSVTQSDWEVPLHQSLEPELRRLLSKALHPDPGRRYRDAADMAADLERYWRERELPSPKGTDAGPPIPLAETVQAGNPSDAVPPASDGPAFAVICDQLLSAIEEGESDSELLRSAVVAALAEARTEKEWRRAEYLRDLVEAHLALASGRLGVAADKLHQIQHVPARQEHWHALSRLLDMAQAVAAGDEPRADAACQALRATPEGALVRQCVDSIDGYSHLKSALVLFTQRPEQAWPELETLPAPLRTGVVDKMLFCSHQLQSSFDQWWDGNFPAANASLAQSLARIEEMPAYLGVPLFAAAGAVRDYQAGAARCEEQLRGLLEYAGRCRGRGEALDRAVVRTGLSDITACMPLIPGRPVLDQGRPGVWLKTFDDLLALVREGRGLPEIESRLAEISPHEAVFDLFRQVIESGSLARPRRAKRRPRGRWRWPQPGQVAQKKWGVAAVVASTLLVGLVLAWPFTNLWPRPPAGTRVVVISASPVLPAPSSTPVPVATQSLADRICLDIVEARQAQEWQRLIDQLAALSAASRPEVAECSAKPLAQLEAEARFQLGMDAYQQGDFRAANQEWAVAAALDPASGAAFKLWMRCASARADPAPAAFESLIQDFGEAQIRQTCQFDPADYLPPTPIPAIDVDVLSAMADKRSILVMPCAEAPCPALYQDEAGRWHFGTFLEDIQSPLLLDAQFQKDMTGQDWEGRVRAVELEFGVASPQPYSFPYRAEFGLQLNLSASQWVRAVLVSEPPFSAAARVAGTDRQAVPCEVVAQGPYVMRDANDTFPRHTLLARWDTAGRLQFYLDGQPLCRDPISSVAPRQVGLYVSSAGLNLEVGRLIVTLASP